MLLLLLLCVPMWAASPAERQELLRVPVWVDSADSPSQFTAADFNARVDGAAVPVIAARGPDDDLVIVVVLDWTEDLGLVDSARDAIIGAIEKLPSQARIALMRAQDGLHVLSDPTSDRAALAAAIRGIPVSGKAGFLDTVEVAARIADSILTKAAVRVGLVYITDSDIYNYREDFINPVINSSDQHDMSRRFPEGLVREKVNKLESKLAGFETPMFIVHLDYRSDRLNEAYQSGIKQLAAASGGSSAFCRSVGEVPDAIAGAFRSVASHYSLVLRMPERHSRIFQVEVASQGQNLTYRNRFVIKR
jgi:hypothetical protein